MAVVVKGKEINISSVIVEDIHMFDYPDFVDAFISYLEYTDGTPLTDEELIQVTDENEGLTNELIHENNLYV